jgi:hypothetical protein
MYVSFFSKFGAEIILQVRSIVSAGLGISQAVGLHGVQPF